jgi:hypothetical protein
MKHLLIYTILFFSIPSFSQKNPFSKLQFDKVVMYDFSGGKGAEDFSIINQKGKLAKSVTKEIVLDKNTIVMLNQKLESRKSFGAGTASCFDPHLGIVYYYKDKPVAHISICMDCNRLSSSKEIPAQNQGKTGEGKETYYFLDGMSKSFRNYLNGLLKKYNFSHQAK